MATSVKVDWNITNTQREVKDAAIAALKDVGELILDASNQQVPVDEGTLMRSGNYDIDDVNLAVNIFYDTPYAVRVHEDLSLRHKNGRRAKFLESAMQANTNKVIELLADSIRRVIE